MGQHLHNITLLLAGGTGRNSGLTVHSGSMCLGLVRNIGTSFIRVNSQMPNMSLHSVRRWIKVISRPHNRQRSVSLRFIPARRTFVGTISCMTLYHSARIVPYVQTACRFCHPMVHGVYGYKVSILISFVPLNAWATVC